MTHSTEKAIRPTDAQAIVARIEADIALLRKICIDPMSIRFANNIDIEVRPEGDDDPCSGGTFWLGPYGCQLHHGGTDS